MKAIILRGVSASGKTTWANEYRRSHPAAIISRDKIRWDIMRDAGVEPCWKNWRWKNESKVTEIQENLIRDIASCGELDIIIADTNLKDEYVEKFRTMFDGTGYEFQTKWFHVSWEEAIRRDAAREHGVGYAVLAQQFQQAYGKTYSQRGTGKTMTVVCDIDGTVAHMHNRGPFDWARVGEDTLDEEIADALRGYSDRGYQIVFVSGRDGVCEPETRAWLNSHFSDFELYMRAPGDTRADDIVKLEILDRDLTRYDIRVWFDDRPRVCRAIRLRGIKVVQVANPYIEF